MTNEIILIALASLFWLNYAFFVLRIRHGLGQLTIPGGNPAQPMVTIVVAAHNEELSISKCLQALLSQSYPAEKMDIIVVDDESTDRTSNVICTLAESNSSVRVITLPAGGHRSRNRKPEAIAEGIRHARGEIIFTTDADCIVPRDWISSMVPYFDSSTALVAGPVKEVGATNLVGRLSSLEFLGLIASAAGLIAEGRPVFCNGANLAYRKSAFVAADGFGNSTSSCDDEVLLQRMHARRIGDIRYSVDDRSIVLTNPAQSLGEFFRQRIRWAAKRGHYEQKGILLKLIALYFAFAVFMILPLLSLFSPAVLLLTIFLLLGKVIIDFLTLRRAGALFHQRFSFVEFIIAELFHVPYIVFAAFLGQVVSPQWKGTRTTP